MGSKTGEVSMAVYFWLEMLTQIGVKSEVISAQQKGRTEIQWQM
jgi:hypothetical protein